MPEDIFVPDHFGYALFRFADLGEVAEPVTTLIDSGQLEWFERLMTAGISFDELCCTNLPAPYRDEVLLVEDAEYPVLARIPLEESQDRGSCFTELTVSHYTSYTDINGNKMYYLLIINRVIPKECNCSAPWTEVVCIDTKLSALDFVEYYKQANKLPFDFEKNRLRAFVLHDENLVYPQK